MKLSIVICVVAGIPVGWGISTFVPESPKPRKVETSFNATPGEAPRLLDGQPRRHSLEDWKKLSLEQDLEKRFQILNHTTWFAEKREEFSEIFTELAKADPDLAIVLAKQVEGRAYMELAWKAILSVVSESSFEEAMSLAEEHCPQKIEELVGDFSEHRPVEALEFLMASDFYRNDPNSGSVVNQALRKWGESDLVSAMEWLLEHSQDSDPYRRTNGISNLLSSAVRKQPELAASLAMEHLSGEQQISVMSDAVARMAREGDADEIVQWSRELEDPVFRVRTQKELINVLAESAPDVAESLAKELPGKQFRSEAISAIAAAKIGDGVNVAIEWVKSLEDPEISSQAALTVAHVWAKTDPKRATDYVLAQNLAPERHQGFLQRLGDQLFSVDVSSGMEWLNRLPPEIRTTVEEHLRVSQSDVLADGQLEVIEE